MDFVTFDIFFLCKEYRVRFISLVYFSLSTRKEPPRKNYRYIRASDCSITGKEFQFDRFDRSLE